MIVIPIHRHTPDGFVAFSPNAEKVVDGKIFTQAALLHSLRKWVVPRHVFCETKTILGFILQQAKVWVGAIQRTQRGVSYQKNLYVGLFQ